MSFLTSLWASWLLHGLELMDCPIYTTDHCLTVVIYTCSYQSPCWPMARSGWQRWLTSTSCAAHSKTPPNRSDSSFWLRSAGETLISHRSWIVLTESWQYYRSGHPILALAAARTNEKRLCHTRRKSNWQSKSKSRTRDTWLVLCVSMAMPPLWWKQLTFDTK